MDTTAHVRFEPTGLEVEIAVDSTVYDAAVSAGAHIEVPCGGIGLCRGCRVIARGELSALDERELRTLSDAEQARGVRLACVARVQGDVTVGLDVARIAATHVSGASSSEVSFIGEIGAAVDVGTTTLAASLVDATTGDEIATTSSVNPQVTYGADVMSRILRASSGGLADLQRAVTGAVEELLATLVDEHAAGGTLSRVSVAGNTTMLHLFLGVEPIGLGQAPYEAAFLGPHETRGAELGWERFTDAVVCTLPNISAFVGADVVAGLLATHVDGRTGTVLFMDMGTNGEIVLKTPDRTCAVSAAAGPAFEGAGIECGMRAAPGAIERVWLEDGALTLGVIDGGEPAGLCGSGLIDLVAILLSEGVLDPTGRMLADAPAPLARAVRDVGGVARFDLDDSGRIFLTQQDVRQVQLAKGAVATAVSLLLEDAGVSVDEVDTVLVAGGFGYHLTPDALVTMGLIPLRWHDRMVFVGNAARTGAAHYLSDEGARARADRIACSTEILDLVMHPGFQDRFVTEMGFPVAT